MGRRGGTARFVCAHPGCRETVFYDYDSQREYADLHRRHYGKWLCIRHSDQERNLRLDNTAVSQVLICTARRRESDGRVYAYIWQAEGATTGSGFDHSSAHTAYAEDFPEGTRLVVTAYVETPEQAAIAREASS